MVLFKELNSVNMAVAPSSNILLLLLSKIITNNIGLTSTKTLNFMLDEDHTHPRIVNGIEATPHEFPWIVHLKYKGFQRCGGTILNENFILTAAHCVHEFDTRRDSLYVYTAEHNYRCTEGVEKIYKVVNVKTHAEYDNGTLWHDIAVIRVEPRIEYNQFVRPGKLAPEQFAYPATLIPAGWGLLQEHDITLLSDKLRKVELSHVPDTECRRIHGTLFRPRIQVCWAGDGVKDACDGDSGGPVHCLTPDGVVVCSLISWGPPEDRCLQNGYPSGGPRLPYYRSWIQRHSNISNPAPPRLIRGCGGYSNGTSARVHMNDMEAGEQCHWTFESEYRVATLGFYEYGLSGDEQIWFTNISHVCLNCAPEPLDLGRPDLTFTFLDSPVFIISVIVSNNHPYFQRNIKLEFTSSGEPYRKSDLVAVRHFRLFHTLPTLNTANLTYPDPKQDLSEYYYNSKDVLYIVTVPSITSARDVTLNCTRMDIAGDGNVGRGCQGDYFSILYLGRSYVGGVEYREAYRDCGQKLPPFTIMFGIMRGLVLARFVSLPNSAFGKGFHCALTVQ